MNGLLVALGYTAAAVVTAAIVARLFERTGDESDTYWPISILLGALWPMTMVGGLIYLGARRIKERLDAKDELRRKWERYAEEYDALADGPREVHSHGPDTHTHAMMGDWHSHRDGPASGKHLPARNE